MVEKYDLLHNMRDLADVESFSAALRALEGILGSLDFSSFVLLRSERFHRDPRWRIIASSSVHHAFQVRSRCPIDDLRSVFGDGSRVILPKSEPSRPTSPPGMGGAALAVHLADVGARSVAAIHSRHRRRLGSLALLACSDTDCAERSQQQLEAFPLLRVALNSLIETCHDEIVAEMPQIPRMERAVLTEFAIGMRPAEIAVRRGTSVRTVRNQLDNARRRLGANSNVHAVTIAIEAGMIETQSVAPTSASVFD